MYIIYMVAASNTLLLIYYVISFIFVILSYYRVIMLLVYSHIRLSLAFHCGFGSREFLDWSLCILHRFHSSYKPLEVSTT